MSLLKQYRQSIVNSFYRFISLFQRKVLMSVLFVFLLCVTVLCGLGFNGTYGRWVHSAVIYIESSISSWGFGLQEVTIKGRKFTTRQSLLEVMDISIEQSIFSIDLNQVVQNIKTLPWVESVTLRRIFPNRLHITLVERKILARFQSGTKNFIIDMSGNIIIPYYASIHPELVIIEGKYGNLHARKFLDQLKKYTFIFDNIIYAKWVANRRWMIELSNGTILHFPENEVDSSLSRLQSIKLESLIPSLRGQEIDLRLPDRIFVRTPKNDSDEIIIKRGTNT